MADGIQVVPVPSSDGLGMGGIGGLLIGSLLGGNRGGLFGNGGGYGGGYGMGGYGMGGIGQAATSAVATDILISPLIQGVQSQISTLSDSINGNETNSAIRDYSAQSSAQHEAIESTLTALSTAQATGNFTTLNSINDLGRDVTAQANQNALQQLNSFNNLTTTTLQGFNSGAFQLNTATNQIIAQGTASAAAMAACCCEILQKIADDGGTTRALITANRMDDLTSALAEARLEASQAAQTAALLTQIRNPTVVV